jgi:hypothetical protein
MTAQNLASSPEVVGDAPGVRITWTQGRNGSLVGIDQHGGTYRIAPSTRTPHDWMMLLSCAGNHVVKFTASQRAAKAAARKVRRTLVPQVLL